MWSVSHYFSKETLTHYSRLEQPSDAIMKKVLVAVNEVLTAFTVKKSLERMGYQVVDVVAAATVTTELILQYAPDVLLLDEVDLVESAAVLNGKNILPLTIICLANAATDANTKASPVWYVTKPFCAKKLEETLLAAQLMVPKAFNKELIHSYS